MTSEGSNKVRVAICGTEYTVRGHATEEDLQLVAKLVDDMMQQVAVANPNLDTKRIAVLTALNMADELHKLGVKYQELLEQRPSSKR